MSVQVLGVCYFLSALVHLKHISARSFQCSQYCKSEDFLFRHLRFITQVCACVLEEKGNVEEKEKKILANRISSTKWSRVNKGKWN